MSKPLRLLTTALSLMLIAAGCGDDDRDPSATATTSPTSTTAAPETTPPPPAPPAPPPPAPPAAGQKVELEVSDVATNLETVWAMAFDSKGKLWFTQRNGRLQQLGGPGRDIPGVQQQGEGGLMGLEFDSRDRIYLMLTSSSDNRVVRLANLQADPEVLVDGIRSAGIHNGGRIRFGRDGTLFAGTGDAGDPSLPQNEDSLNGKILSIDTGTKKASVFGTGFRNPQGLCFDPAGRFLSTEHGPVGGDEINVVTRGINGGWPDKTGNGIKNYTPSIAPAGCAVYEADAIPQWKGSMLFTTLKEKDLRRLTFAPDGSVAGEEILYDEKFGRLRDVTVGPDGHVYLATSNKDTRGNPKRGDDRIIRIAPKG